MHIIFDYNNKFYISVVTETGFGLSACYVILAYNNNSI
jgi:hypothetical protein